MYFTGLTSGEIWRANLDGSAVELLLTGLRSPLGIALEIDGEMMYWTENGPGVVNKKISRRGFLAPDSSIELLVTGNLGNPRDIVLDLSCVGSAKGTPCNDGNICTESDQCIAGACAGEPISGVCDDGDPCTGSDVCVNGVCEGPEDPSLCLHFSLLATAINGQPCPSCPTANVPSDEVLPGDVITVEAFLSNWGTDEDSGLCRDGMACSVAAQDCGGSRCEYVPVMTCASDADCGADDGHCVQDRCFQLPLITAFQWSVEEVELTGGLSGTLTPATLSCIGDDDCRHGAVSADECTCGGALCSPEGLCGPEATFFIETNRPNYIFAAEQHISAFSPVD